ncbi:MAG: MFS transporter [Hyphomicrobiales bacterium]|nr:MFS transporter [Hyphomicrobiales bacterium]
MTDDEAYAAGYIDAAARREYWRAAIGMFLVSFTTAHQTLLSIVFARNGHDLHTIGVLLSSIAVPIVFFALMSSEFSARLGVLPTMRLAMFLSLAGFASLYFTSATFFGALASRFVSGAGGGLFLAAALTYGQSRLSPKRFLFLLSVFSAMMPLAQAVAPAFGEYTLNAYGAHGMFLIGSIPAVVGMALSLGLRPLAKPPQSRGLDLLASWRPRFVEPLLSMIVAGTLYGFTTAYLAPALEARSIPLGAFFTASTLTMFASRAFGFRRIEEANKRYLVGFGLALEAAGLVAVSFAGAHVWPVSAGGIIFGLGHSLLYPVLAAWMVQGVDATRRSGPQAWLNACFNIGLYATPLPETFIVARVGYDWTMVVLAAAAAIAAATLVLRGALSGAPTA